MEEFEMELWNYLRKKIKDAKVRKEVHNEIMRKMKKYCKEDAE